MVATAALDVRSVPIGMIDIGDRHRQDLGDIDELASSIIDVGLLQPIVVTRDYRLVAGRRRLAAMAELGEAEVPAHVVDGLDDAAALLRAERDENTCRKQMTASELHAIGKAIEALKRPEAREAQGGSGRFGSGSEPTGPKPGAAHKHDTQGAVAEGIGLSRTQWQRLRYLGDRRDEGDDYAAELLAKVEADELTLSAAYDQHRAWANQRRQLQAQSKAERSPCPPKRSSAEARAEQIHDLAEQGHRAIQIAERLGIGVERVRSLAREHGITLPDAYIGKTRHIDPNRIVSETVVAAEGLALGLALLDGEMDHLDPSQVEAWATSLSNSLRSLNRLAKQLKEMAP